MFELLWNTLPSDSVASAEAGADGHSPNTQTKPAADHAHARFINPPCYTYRYGSGGGIVSPQSEYLHLVEPIMNARSTQ